LIFVELNVEDLLIVNSPDSKAAVIVVDRDVKDDSLSWVTFSSTWELTPERSLTGSVVL